MERGKEKLAGLFHGWWVGKLVLSKDFVISTKHAINEKVPSQPSKLNFSFGGHLATNSLGLVAKGFY